MTDYTPTTQQVRDAYVRAMRNAFIASASELQTEFDRWLADDRAIAWARGYAAGASDDFTNQSHRANNPYRENANE